MSEVLEKSPDECASQEFLKSSTWPAVFDGQIGTEYDDELYASIERRPTTLHDLFRTAQVIQDAINQDGAILAFFGTSLSTINTIAVEMFGRIIVKNKNYTGWSCITGCRVSRLDGRVLFDSIPSLETKEKRR